MKTIIGKRSALLTLAVVMTITAMSQAQTYYAAVNVALDEEPEFATVANKDKQNFNNRLIGFAGLLIAGYTEGKQNNDGPTIESYRKLAGELIRMVLKTDPQNLRLENGQIVVN